MIAGDRLPGDVAIDDVLIAGVAALDHEILDGSVEAGLADERCEELLRAARAMPRLAEGDERIVSERRDDVAAAGTSVRLSAELTGGRPMASGQQRERHHGASREGGFHRRAL